MYFILNILSENIESDLATCQKENRQTVTVIAIIEIRFYVFWWGWFQVYIVEIRIAVLTGDTTTTATTTTGSITTARGLRRYNSWRGRSHWKRNYN